MIGMDRRTGVALDGMAHLRQSIEDILSTPIGTRLCRRDYGSDLPELLDQPMNDLTRLRIYAATAMALARQERRLSLSRVALKAGAAPGVFALDLTGTAAASGRRTPFAFSLPVRALSALSA
jgi:phage baseplate assembly protein W